MGGMNLSEMVGHLEAIARDDQAPPSSRVRAIEVLARLARTQTPEDQEWQAIVEQFGEANASE